MKKEGILFALIILLMVSLIFAGELRVTQEHPFFVDDEWVTASDLQVGDELITSDGSLVRITSIKDVSENVEVYNLDSSETDDFVVGEENIVVHNSEEASICPKPKTEPIPDTYKLPEKGCKGKYRITPNSQVTREELIDFFGRDPIKDSKPITGIDETNINGIIGPDGKLWVVKESISAGPKEELGGDVKAESVGREIINYAGGESKNSVKTPEGFSYVGENGEAYLFYRYVEGTTFSGSETVAEQIHQVYCGDDAYEVRARMAISQILGGFKDSNNNGFIKTKDGVAQIDTEYIGSANDIGPFEFRVGVQNDLEPGFSPIPQYNNKKFADTLRCLARQELSKPESEYASRMKDALEKAGYKGEHLEKKLSELIENRRKLLEHINKRLQMLEEDGLRTYDNNLDSISSYPEDSRFSRTNPDDVTLTAQMVTPEKHISADRKAEIDLKIVNGESAKGLDDTERLYYAEKLLGRELTPEEKKQILAIHKSEESNYVKGRRARKEAGLSEDETRKLMENWVLGEEIIGVIDLSRGKKTIPGEDYIIRDPYGFFGEEPTPNLNRIKTVVREWETRVKDGTMSQEEFDNNLKDAQEVYGSELVNQGHNSNKNQRKVINQFLKALKMEIPKESSNILTYEEERAIINAFINHRWSGNKFHRSQTDIFGENGLETRVLPNGHIEVYYEEDPSLKIQISSTPSHTSSQAFAGEKIAELINKIRTIQ